MDKPHISVILPAFNEEHRIGSYLHAIRDYLSKKNYPYEVVVVNDGCTDRTSDVVNTFHGLHPNIREVSYDGNKGKGYAVKYGISAAKGDYILIADADGSVTIDHIDLFMKEITKGYDIIIGSIELPGEEKDVIEHNQWYRRKLGSAAKKLIRFIATPGIYDTQRGFKLYKKSVALNVFEYLTINRWGFDIEAIVIAQRHRYKIKEVQVAWDNPDGSTIVGLKSYVTTLVELVQIVTKRVIGAYTPREEVVSASDSQEAGSHLQA